MDKLTVTFEIDKLDDAINMINNSEWKEKMGSSSSREISFQLVHNEISSLNRFFVERGFSVNSIIPIRSLEDFFLKITEGDGK